MSNKSHDGKEAWITLRKIDKKICKLIETQKLKGMYASKNRIIKKPWEYPDYIIIKNGKITYIEHKRKGDKLSPLQNSKFKELVRNGEKIYLVEYEKIKNGKKTFFPLIDQSKNKNREYFILLDNNEKINAHSKLSKQVAVAKKAWRTRNKK